MTSIAVQLWGTSDPAMVQITVSDVPAGARVTVRREIPDASAQRVRGGYDETPNGALVILDAGAPLGRPVVYVATTTTTAGAVSEVSAPAIVVPDSHADLDWGRHILSDPLTGRALRLDLLRSPLARKMPARGAQLEPAGRADPIIITDVRGTKTGTLLATTTSAIDARRLEQLLQPGSHLISRHAADGCDVPAVEVIAIGDVMHQTWGRVGRRIWEADYVVTGEPDPSIPVAGVTLGDLAAYTTGQTLATFPTLWATLLDLARDDLDAA